VEKNRASCDESSDDVGRFLNMGHSAMADGVRFNSENSDGQKTPDFAHLNAHAYPAVREAMIEALRKCVDGLTTKDFRP